MIILRIDLPSRIVRSGVEITPNTHHMGSLVVERLVSLLHVRSHSYFKSDCWSSLRIASVNASILAVEPDIKCLRGKLFKKGRPEALSLDFG